MSIWVSRAIRNESQLICIVFSSHTLQMANRGLIYSPRSELAIANTTSLIVYRRTIQRVYTRSVTSRSDASQRLLH
jgi:hypothetical protein